MITVKLRLKTTGEPLERVPVALAFDADQHVTPPVTTDLGGEAHFAVPAGPGKVLVDGVERYHGILRDEILIDLWSVAQSAASSSGAPRAVAGGSIAYPSMQTKTLLVAGREVLVDSEGYLVQPSEWSEDFARAQAQAEGLELTAEHWEVVRFLREYYDEHGVQAAVRDMVKHFRVAWGEEKGSSSYLHSIFPRGGPQKQGNRLAGILRTKGEH
jgi:tRNA 2-thiouridine synthesizing protein E